MATSDEDSDHVWLSARLKDSLERAERLVQRCSASLDLAGMRRFRKKCIAEQRFLQRLEEDISCVRAANLTSSNLIHLESTVGLLDHLPLVVEIQKSLRLFSRSQPIHVDIVCNCGYTWVKVIARNTKALEMDVAGCLEYGEKSLLSQAQDLVELSHHHPLNFVTPLVVFYFTNTIPLSLQSQLSLLGVKVISDQDLTSESFLESDLLPEGSNEAMHRRPMALADDESGIKIVAQFNQLSCNASNTEVASPNQQPEKFYDSDESLTLNATKELGERSHILIGNEDRSDTGKLCEISYKRCPSHEIVSCVARCNHLCGDCERREDGGDTTVGRQVSEDGMLKEKCESQYTFKTQFDLCLLPNEHNCPVGQVSDISLRADDPSYSPADLNIQELRVGAGEHEAAPEERITSDEVSDDNVSICLNKAMPVYDNDNAALSTTQTSLTSTSSGLPSMMTSDLCPSCDTLPQSCNVSTKAGAQTRIIRELSIVMSIKPALTKVNLDVTAMIVLISNLCHGMNDFIFSDHILTQQATEERSSPALPQLLDFITGKHLLACSTALKDFQAILSTIGGKEEKRRAEILLAVVQPIPDEPSCRALSLKTSGRIKMRSKIVFGTGDGVEAVTVTANEGFVRAARQFGVEFSVFVHPARALTEQKQASATPLTTVLPEQKQVSATPLTTVLPAQKPASATPLTTVLPEQKPASATPLTTVLPEQKQAGDEPEVIILAEQRQESDKPRTTSLPELKQKSAKPQTTVVYEEKPHSAQQLLVAQ